MSYQIDPRGQRFAAAITSAFLVAALLGAPSPAGLLLLTAQAALFATAVLRGVQGTPVAAVYRSVLRPRLGPPAHLEDAAPPRFAQGVGLAFVAVALVGFAAGADAVGYIATAFALVAALLNATIGLCLGCEAFIVGRRVLALTTTTSEEIPATRTATRMGSTT